MDAPARLEVLLAEREWVRSLARTLTRDENAADDLEQEAWLAAVQRPPGDVSTPRGWLATVLRRAAGKDRRGQSRRDRRERAAARPEAIPPALDVVAAAEWHARVARAVVDLPEPYRRTVLLRWFESLPPREVAARMGVPVETARSRAQRGIALLRERLDADHGGDRRAWAVPVLALGGPGSGGVGIAATTTGAVLMASATKMGIAAAVVVAVGLGLFFLWPRGGNAHSPRPIDPAEDARVVGGSPPTLAKGAAGMSSEVAGEAGSPPSEPEGTASEPADGEIWISEEGSPEKGIRACVRAVSETGLETSGWATSDGWFWLADERFRRVASVWVWADGYAAKRIGPLDLSQRGARVALAPFPPVRVRFEDGGAEVPPAEAQRRFEVAKAKPEVVFVSESDLLGGPPLDMLRRQFAPAEAWQCRATVTFDANSARIDPTPGEGAYWVMTTRAGAAPWFDRVTLGETAETRVVTVPLPSRVTTVRVRAVADETGQPVAGAVAVPYVEYGDDAAFLRGWSDGVRGDVRGEIEIPVIETAPQGRREATWWITAPDRAGSIATDVLRRAPGGVKELRLRRTVTVSGTAWDHDGKPAGGRQVVSSQKGRTVTAVVGPDGKFVLYDVVPGASLYVVLDPEALDVVGAKVPLDAGPTWDARLGSPDAATTTGVVHGRVTAGGAPLPGVLVGLGKKAGRFLTTDADGRFRAAGVAPGEHAFQMALGDLSVADDFWIRSTTPLRVAAGSDQTLDFDLPPGVLRVRVVDENGVPIARALAYSVPEDRKAERDRFPGFEFSPGWAATTDDQGWATLVGLVHAAPHRLLFGPSDRSRKPEERTGVLPGTAAVPVEVVVRVAR